VIQEARLPEAYKGADYAEIEKDRRSDHQGPGPRIAMWSKEPYAGYSKAHRHDPEGVHKSVE